MSQNIEIEFKNILTEEEFNMLADAFHLKDIDFKEQVNHYFDTVQFSLKAKGSALRIREKGHRFEMTLKQPQKEGLLETNKELSAEEVQKAIESNSLPTGSIQRIVEDIGVSYQQLEYFGSLVTKRAEIKIDGGLLVLDHSYYLNTEDFEVEFEVESFESGQTIFNALLERQGIPKRETDNKISRFYKQKLLLNETLD